MFCVQCGHELTEGSRFCSFCGHASGTEPAAQPQSPSISATPATPIYIYSIPMTQPPVTPGSTVSSAAPAQPLYARTSAPQARPATVSAAPAYPSGCTSVPGGTAPAYGTTPTTEAAFSAGAAPATTTEQPADSAAETPDSFVPEPTPEDTAPLSVGQYIVSLLALLVLPIGNIVFACVWGFKANGNPHRRNLARAALPFIAVGLLLLFFALLFLLVRVESISLVLR